MQEHQPPLLLLTLLQRFTNNSRKIKQIHSLIITNGYFLVTTNWINTLLYNSLIRRHGLFKPKNTFVLFRQMLNQNAPPNKLTFPFLIKAAATLLPPEASLAGKPLGAQCFRRGVWEDPFVRTSFLSLFADLGDVESARKLFDEIPHPNVVSRNAMIDAFAKNGDMNSAVLMFSGMDKRDIYTWTSLINGYAKNERFSEAIESFRTMLFDKDDVVRPDEATFVCVLSCCANLEGGKAILHGKQIHGYMMKNESELSVYMETALITFYGKTACFEYADRLFSTMSFKEVCTWNAMICSLALQCREKDAFNMFIAMKKAGFSPNGVTFVGLLSACARSKLVDFGLEIFHSMQRKYGVVPEMEHYGCIVDLLGRAGMIGEAYEFMEKMPFSADASVLGALLGACKIHGEAEMAAEIGQRILAEEPRPCGRYVQLSTIYAGAERWDSAAAVRRVMVDAGVQKVPGCSMVHQK